MAKTFLRNLQIGFGISLLILVLSSVASLMSISKLQQSRVDLTGVREKIQAVNNILIDLQDIETGQRGYLITGREEFLGPYNNGIKNIVSSVDRALEFADSDNYTSKKIKSLSILVDERIAILEDILLKKRNGEVITFLNLEKGRNYMDKCRQLISDIIRHEEQLLEKNDAKLKSYLFFSILFILIAVGASICTAVYFYNLIKNDFRKREELQKALREKEAEMSHRIAIISGIAEKISKGNYDIEIKDDEEDNLGSLSMSLHSMAQALKESFNKLTINEWEQTGLVALNKSLFGNKNIEAICTEVLQFVCNYINCYNGAIYLWESDKIVLKSYYALDGNMAKRLDIGEGMVGQVFRDKEFKHFENLDSEEFVVSFSNGKVKVKDIILMPLILDNECIGVIELGLINKPKPEEIRFFRESCRDIAIGLSDAYNRNKIQALLEEAQTQAEELQMQHSELEGLNTELEAQTQKLQASEEELKVQQEELLQSNQELEERSKLLEEKNQLIAERNLDIQKKVEELALSTKYKSEFLTNMSHELRTPLNSILLLSRLMSENIEGNLNDDQIESARVIQSSGASLLELIDEILDLSKIEAGKMKLDIELVNLTTVIQGLESLFLPIVKEKHLTFDLNIDKNVGHTIETDRMRLEQVMKNLLSNAIKFTSKGSISLTLSQEDEHILLAVKDTGIGIPYSKQKYIFEAFQQADGSTSRKFGGTGLGLSISREIAKLLGGEIRLISKENEGSTFTLVLPLKYIKQPVEPVSSSTDLVEEIVSDVVEIQRITNETNENNLTTFTIPDEVEDDRNSIKEGDRVILIVEDDVNFAKTLLKYTKHRGYKGIVVVRGDLAAEFAVKYQPLAILLDIQLPIKDGWQVMDEIKSNPVTKHIPVHIMSSLKVKKESLLKGAVDFIDKPIALEQIDDMFKKIEEALKKHPKKVLIIEENLKHASALAYFLSTFNIHADIKTNVEDSIIALSSEKVDCVILDMGGIGSPAYETLELVKKNPELEHLPIIVFTGKYLSQSEEVKLRQYADSIVLKTAHSYQRVLDEVGLFLHLVEENQLDKDLKLTNKLGVLKEVLKDKKVLIADDDVRNIFSLTKALEKYQMTVISAIDGKEALAQLEKNSDIAIVLMDMMMPEMDGYETIREIRKTKTGEKLPIIAVTAKAMLGDREKCIKAGASDYISKPVDTDQLLSLLRVWLYE